MDLIHKDRPVAGFCKHANETSVSVKGEEFLTSQRTVNSSGRILLCVGNYFCFLMLVTVVTVKLKII
jgi:hypothetical protein